MFGPSTCPLEWTFQGPPNPLSLLLTLFIKEIAAQKCALVHKEARLHGFIVSFFSLQTYHLYR